MVYIYKCIGENSRWVSPPFRCTKIRRTKFYAKVPVQYIYIKTPPFVDLCSAHKTFFPIPAHRTSSLLPIGWQCRTRIHKRPFCETADHSCQNTAVLIHGFSFHRQKIFNYIELFLLQLTTTVFHVVIRMIGSCPMGENG